METETSKGKGDCAGYLHNVNSFPQQMKTSSTIRSRTKSPTRTRTRCRNVSPASAAPPHGHAHKRLDVQTHAQ